MDLQDNNNHINDEICSSRMFYDGSSWYFAIGCFDSLSKRQEEMMRTYLWRRDDGHYDEWKGAVWHRWTKYLRYSVGPLSPASRQIHTKVSTSVPYHDHDVSYHMNSDTTFVHEDGLTSINNCNSITIIATLNRYIKSPMVSCHRFLVGHNCSSICPRIWFAQQIFGHQIMYYVSTLLVGRYHPTLTIDGRDNNFVLCRHDGSPNHSTMYRVSRGIEQRVFVVWHINMYYVYHYIPLQMMMRELLLVEKFDNQPSVSAVLHRSNKLFEPCTLSDCKAIQSNTI